MSEQWISVKDRLPKKGERVVWTGKPKTSSDWAEIGHYNPSKKWYGFPWRDRWGSGDGPSVTHWMPLPAPPDREEERKVR